MAKKRPSIRTLKKKLDAVFSEYVRRRDTLDNGLVQCCSCGKYFHWKNMDCGHFVSRRVNSVRFDERNTGPQCRSCNRFHHGMAAGFALYIKKRYGEGTIEELHRLSNEIKRFRVGELQEVMKYYRDKLKELKNGQE
jgi:hypothetical protein